MSDARIYEALERRDVLARIDRLERTVAEIVERLDRLERGDE